MYRRRRSSRRRSFGSYFSSFGRSRRSSGVSSATVRKMISSSNRAKSGYSKRKNKKNLMYLLIVGALAGLGWFFRDKLKAILKIA